jgi:hypothetical protein
MRIQYTSSVCRGSGKIEKKEKENEGEDETNLV